MEELLAMGFDRSTAQRALNASGGDIERAIESLLSGPEPSEAVSLSCYLVN